MCIALPPRNCLPLIMRECCAISMGAACHVYTTRLDLPEPKRVVVDGTDLSATELKLRHVNQSMTYTAQRVPFQVTVRVATNTVFNVRLLEASGQAPLEVRTGWTTCPQAQLCWLIGCTTARPITKQPKPPRSSFTCRQSASRGTLPGGGSSSHPDPGCASGVPPPKKRRTPVWESGPPRAAPRSESEPSHAADRGDSVVDCS